MKSHSRQRSVGTGFANPSAPEASRATSREKPADDDLSRSQLLPLLKRERAETEQLQSSLALRSCALDAASTHFMIMDLAREGWPIVYVNRALARDHGYEPDELLGQSAAVLAPVALNPTQTEAIDHTLRAGRSLRTELRSRRKDGSTFWTGITLEPIRNAVGDVTHYVSIGADITVRLEEEKEKRNLQDRLYNEMHERERIAIELRFAQKLESVGRLAAGIAHEINTPIQYIGDCVTFLQSGLSEFETLLRAYQSACSNLGASQAAAAVLDELKSVEAGIDWPFLRVEMPKAIERTLDGVARVASIVHAMKEFAHPDAGEQSAADLNHAIETTLAVARGEYKYVATVETQFEEGLPEVLCTIGEINQVFLNLIVNAAHAIEQAGKDAATGHIHISTARSGPWAEVVISDNGCGIPDENMEKIFDPFFTTKEVGRGTGQGLAIARSIIVDKHGGSIDVLSRIKLGTRFRIRLPIAGRNKDSVSK